MRLVGLCSQAYWHGVLSVCVRMHIGTRLVGFVRAWLPWLPGGACADGAYADEACPGGACADGACTGGACIDGGCADGGCAGGACTGGGCTDGARADGGCVDGGQASRAVD